MMGTLVARRQLGQVAAQPSTVTKVVSAGVGVTGGILAALAATGPIGMAAGALAAAISLIPGVMGIINGCGETCINDTEVTEGVQQVYNSLWFALTGEDFGGFAGSKTCTCTPGQCGKQKCGIFDPQGTQYPNVPSGPLGYIDANAVIEQATQIYQAGRQKLLRSQSLQDYDANYNGAMAKYQMVLAAQATAPPVSASSVSAPGTVGAVASSLLSSATSLFQSPTTLLLVGLGILAIAELS